MKVLHLIPVIRTQYAINSRFSLLWEWGLGYFHIAKTRDSGTIFDQNTFVEQTDGIGLKFDMGFNYKWFEIRPGVKVFGNDAEMYLNLSAGFRFDW